ncbi:prokineticin receptor 1-like [Amphiura filiformis]|uniref:prokineticin receptor 1-like n=1 Tax=Amphiura filiformis TaxID=82378 RepID=UPI003B211E26
MIPVCGIGNLLLCYIIYRFRRMRSTTNLLIGNLAFSDFMLAVVVAPFNFYYYMNQDWPFGKAMCVIVAYLKAVSLYVSTNSLLVIAIDRYVIIMYPLRPRMTKRTAVILMVFIWLLSMSMVIPTAIHTEIGEFYHFGHSPSYQCLEYGWKNHVFLKAYTLSLTILEFIAPMAIMCVVYFLIAVKLWYREVPGGHLTAQQEIEIESSKRKTVRMLIIVVALFMLCWAPYYVVALLRDVAYYALPAMQVDNHSLSLTIYYIVEMLAMSNSMFNTLIYIIFNANFRKHVKQLPEVWCGKSGVATKNTGTRKYWLPLTTNSNVRSSMRSSTGRSIPLANQYSTRLKRDRPNGPPGQAVRGNDYVPCNGY